MLAIRSILLLLAMLALPASAAPAATVPSDFDDRRVASVLMPTSLAPLPDGRLLIGTQGGVVRSVEDGGLRPALPLDISSTTCFVHEAGFLGITADPQFATNHFIYVFATRRLADGTCVNRVSRFVLDGDVADPASEVVLLTMYATPTGAHAGGDLHFGKDGYLYITTGDGLCDYAGGSCDGQNDASRDPHTLLGKILRITRDGAIPPENPYVLTGSRCNVTGQTTVGTPCLETFASGLRNPYRFAFDPNAAGTRFFINDVGQRHWEEINEGVAGADYGWNVREGHCQRGSFTNCPPPPTGMRDPIFDYSHEGACSAVTGGVFVPDGVWPSPYGGAYLYSDYVCGTIFRLAQGAGGVYSGHPFVTDLGASSATAMTFAGQGSSRALYYASYANGGEIRRLAYTGVSNRPPVAAVSAAPDSGASPLEVTLDGSASADPDVGDFLTYSWDFGDGSPPVETSTASVTHTYGLSSPIPPPRTYTATLRIRDDKGAVSDPATVRVNVGNTPPVPTIETPASDLRFRVGEPLVLEGSASDAEDGTLADTRLTWELVRVHTTHTHPFLSPRSGKDGANDVEFTAPGPEDLGSAAGSHLELRLTATDSAGGSTTVTQALRPHLVDLSVASSPSGLEVSVEGLSVTTPQAPTSWEGYRVAIGASDQTTADGDEYAFESWSDGGAAEHTITTPATASTVTAIFHPQTSSYRSRILGTPGLIGYWRLGDAVGPGAVDELGTGVGTFTGGVTLGAPGALIGESNAAARFDGVNAEATLDAPGLNMTTSGTIEGWFDWEAGRALMRDNTNNGGWVLAFGDGGKIAYTLAGVTRITTVDTVSVQNGWHHFVLTKAGPTGSLYIDGVQVHTQGGHGSGAAIRPWHVMRNGVNAKYTRGRADEIAFYNTALSAETIAQHYALGTTASGTTPSQDPAPAAPTGLTAAAGNGSVTLDWNDNGDADLAGYDVYRGTTSGGPYSKINAAVLPGSSYTDSSAANGTTYHYVVRAVDGAGQQSTDSNQASATPTAPISGPSAYADAVSATPGLVAYWRLGDPSGLIATDWLGLRPGSYRGGALLGAPGALAGDPNTAAAFDGVNDEVTMTAATGLVPAGQATLEGWFYWEAGKALLRDSTNNGGWALAFNSSGKVGYILAGATRTTATPVTSVQNGWHHFALTKSGAIGSLYIDGVLVHTQGGHNNAKPLLPWRVMHNGLNANFSRGRADEVAIYNVALPPETVAQHYAAS
jgi:glucose/arabinose dehydrogenase